MIKFIRNTPIVLDALLVLVLVSLLLAFYSLHNRYQPELPVPSAKSVATVVTTTAITPEDCDEAKRLYDRTYFKSLHPFNDYVDWEALDKIFYENYKDCT